MNNRAIGVSVLAALFAVLIIQSYINGQEEVWKEKFGTEQNIIVAATDVGEMSEIEKSMLTVKSIPKEFVEPSAIRVDRKPESPDEPVAELNRLIGSIALVPLKEGEQVTYTKLAEAGIRTGLAPQIAPGKRAISIAADETSAVGKLMKPGDRVDVIAVFDNPSQKENRIARTVLQDVPVLAIGKFITNNPAMVKEGAVLKPRVKNLAEYDAFSSVTLEMEPSEAQMIVLLQNSGSKLSVALRNNDDNERVTPQGVFLKDIQEGNFGSLRRSPSSASVPQPGGGVRP